MKPSYDLSGSQVQAQRDYPIATVTNIKQDTFVKLSAGLVVQAAVGETAAILGSAAETHSGSADAFNARAAGLLIRVNDSPTQVFETVAPQLTATTGSTTTLVVNDATLATYSDNDFNGGFMKLISKAASSTNTDAIGTVYPITGFTAASKTFTTTQTAGGAVTAGDVFAIFPPIGFAKGNLNATFEKYSLAATAALALKTTGFDTSKNLVFMEAALHQNSNKTS